MTENVESIDKREFISEEAHDCGAIGLRCYHQVCRHGEEKEIDYVSVGAVVQFAKTYGRSTEFHYDAETKEEARKVLNEIRLHESFVREAREFLERNIEKAEFPERDDDSEQDITAT